MIEATCNDSQPEYRRCPVQYQFLLVTFGALRDSQRWWVYPDSGFFSRDQILERVEFLFNRTYKKAFGPKTSRIIRLARALDSKHADLIQLADLLLGCSACAEYAYTPQSSPRRALLMHFQDRLNTTKVTQRGMPKCVVRAWITPEHFFATLRESAVITYDNVGD